MCVSENEMVCVCVCWGGALLSILKHRYRETHKSGSLFPNKNRNIPKPILATCQPLWLNVCLLVDVDM